MGYDVFQFGALNLDGKIQPVPQCPLNGNDIPQYNGKATISLGASAPGEDITWIKPSSSNLLVADRVLLTTVSWEDLDKNDFVAGKPVLLDGQRFRCRLLWVGQEEDAPNEWDRILDATNEDNALWHWGSAHFWGADMVARNASYRAFRGWLSAREWDNNYATYRCDILGFRPVLEPLPSNNPTPNINLDGVDFQLTSLPGSNAICLVLQPMQENAFKDIPTESRIRMYTLVENGRPIHFGTEVEDVSKLTLTDCYFGDEYLVPWVISNGVAVADRL